VDEWTEVLGDRDNPDDNGIPPPFYRYATALFCECYRNIDSLRDLAADTATEILEALPSEPKESEHDGHDWAIVQYLRAISIQEQCQLPPVYGDGRIYTPNYPTSEPDSPNSAGSTPKGIHGHDNDMMSPSPITAPVSMDGQDTAIFDTTINTTELAFVLPIDTDDQPMLESPTTTLDFEQRLVLDSWSTTPRSSPKVRPHPSLPDDV
jgi:hypothetical protein